MNRARLGRGIPALPPQSPPAIFFLSTIWEPGTGYLWSDRWTKRLPSPSQVLGIKAESRCGVDFPGLDEPGAVYQEVPAAGNLRGHVHGYSTHFPQVLADFLPVHRFVRAFFLYSPPFAGEDFAACVLVQVLPAQLWPHTFPGLEIASAPFPRVFAIGFEFILNFLFRSFSFCLLFFPFSVFSFLSLPD